MEADTKDYRSVVAWEGGMAGMGRGITMWHEETLDDENIIFMVMMVS